MATSGEISQPINKGTNLQSQDSPAFEHNSTAPTFDLVIRLANSKTLSPHIDINSAEGKRRITNIKTFLYLPESTSHLRVYNFTVRASSGLKYNMHRISMSGAQQVVLNEDGEPAQIMNTLFVQSSQAAWATNCEIMDQFNSLDWQTYFDSLTNNIHRPVAIRRATKDKDEDWVPASQIRTLRAVPKFNPYSIPWIYARHIPRKQSPLSTVTIVLEDHETNSPIDTSRFHDYIVVKPSVEIGLEDSTSFSSDSDSDCSMSTSSSWSTRASVGANSIGGTVAACYNVGIEVDPEYQNKPVPSEPALCHSVEFYAQLVSYHTPYGKELLRIIQGYLDRPEGEEAHETSEWIDGNRNFMDCIRLHDACVTLSASIQKRIAAGRVDEALAQFEARTELKNAIAALDWDEIDDEPIF